MKTLTKTSVHYHPDKKSKAPNKSDEQKRQELLRDEITVIINQLMKELE